MKNKKYIKSIIISLVISGLAVLAYNIYNPEITVFLELDKLKSNPIIPLHPSVPNFILSNLSAVKLKISLISSNYLY